MSGVIGNEIIINDDGTIACQDQLVTGVSHRHILRGPLVVPSGTVGPSTLGISKYRFEYLGFSYKTYAWPTVPSQANAESDANSAIALMSYYGVGNYSGLGLWKESAVTYSGTYTTGFGFTPDAVAIHGVVTLHSGTLQKYRKITRATLALTKTGDLRASITTSPTTTAFAVYGGGTSAGINIDITAAYDSANRGRYPLYLQLQGPDAGTFTRTNRNTVTVNELVPPWRTQQFTNFTVATPDISTLANLSAITLTYDWVFDITAV